MKNVLITLITLASVSASAGVKLVSEVDRGVSLRVTGKDADTLKKILEIGIEINKAGELDPSTFRSIECKKDYCDLVVDARLMTNKDTADYYMDSFNKKLSGLKDNQVLVTTSMMGRDNGNMPTQNDGELMRALMYNTDIKGVSVELERRLNNKLKPDQISIGVMQAKAELSDISITCYTSVLLMGSVNTVENTCGVEIVAEK
jgi:hypothetical protein